MERIVFKEKMGFTGEHKIPTTPKLENIDDMSKWASLDPEKVMRLKFPEFSGQPRAAVFSKMLSLDYEDKDRYDLPGIEYQEFLLQNPDKAPVYMKEKGDRRYFFIKPRSASRGTYLSYLSWDPQKSIFRKYVDVSDRMPWDHTQDRVVVIAK